MSEEYTFFWHGPFSQWHPSKFDVDGVTYKCMEQYMMANKAMLFDDSVCLKKILDSHSPREQKHLGRTVIGFNKTTWNGVARQIVKDGNYAKFTQNSDLKQLLLDTVGTTLVEASPYDKIWGIGLTEDDPKRLDKKNWKGTNWLGQVLTEVRDQIIVEEEQ